MIKLPFVILVLFFVASTQGTLTNVDVKRTIDISSQLAKHVIDLTVSNQGKEAVSSLHFSLPKEQASHLSLLSIVDSKKQKLEVAKEVTEKDGVALYTVALSTPLAPSATENLKIKAIFTHVLTPFPTHITQSERQLIKYKDNVYFFSPYLTEKQATIVKLASSSIQYNSDKHPTVVKDNTINYGPYSNIKPFTISELLVHYENNKPFLTVTSSTRLLELSHWGNVAVEDWFNIRHDGAKLRGSFSRYEFQINPQANGQAAIKSMALSLPGNAEEVYYRDDIGNVTTSHLSMRQRRPGLNHQHLELFPRFPLFGGWQTEFYMGYNVPLGDYLSIDQNGVYVLNITIGPDFLAATVFDEHAVHVILPEGASDIQLIVPFRTKNETRYKHQTYLDTEGRPVVKFQLDNIVNEHVNRYFQVTYQFGTLSLLREPLLLIASYFVFLLIVMFFLRFRLTILPSKSVRPTTAAKLTEAISKVLDLTKQREVLLSSIESDKNVKGVKGNPNEKKLVQIAKDVAKVQLEISKLDDSIGGKVSALEKKQKEKYDSLTEVKKLLAKKEKSSLPKDQEKILEDLDKKIQVLDSDIKEIIDELVDYLE